MDAADGFYAAADGIREIGAYRGFTGYGFPKNNAHLLGHGTAMSGGTNAQPRFGSFIQVSDEEVRHIAMISLQAQEEYT